MSTKTNIAAAVEYVTTATEAATIKAAAEALANAGAYSMKAREHATEALRAHAANEDGTGGNYAGWMAVANDGKAFYVDFAAAKGIELTDSARDTAWSRLVAKTGLKKPKSTTSSGNRPGSAGSANAGSGNPRPKRDADYHRAAEQAAKEAAAKLTADAEKAREQGNTKSAERIASKAAAKMLEAQLAAAKAAEKQLAAEQDAAEKAEKAARELADAAAKQVREALADKDTAAFLVECLNNRAAVEAALKAATAKPTTTSKTRSKPTAKAATA